MVVIATSVTVVVAMVNKDDQDSFALVNRPMQDDSFPESGKFEITENLDKGSFNNYVDRILSFFAPPPHLVHVVIE